VQDSLRQDVAPSIIYLLVLEREGGLSSLYSPALRFSAQSVTMHSTCSPKGRSFFVTSIETRLFFKVKQNGLTSIVDVTITICQQTEDSYIAATARQLMCSGLSMRHDTWPSGTPIGFLDGVKQ
jgi:hypothetical protein